MRAVFLLLAAALVPALGEIAVRWPAEPVADEDGSLFRKLQVRLGVKADAVFDAAPEHARMLTEASAGTPPTYDDIASYNIILFSSIIIVVVFYFSIMAMVNMDYQGDSLLYSKSKSD
jgi:hypothetical protein